ncbi:MAG: hypothetical protein ACE5I1_11245 [bacterium]
MLLTEPLSGKLARVAFLLYMFFVFFGTAMPFQEKLADAGDLNTSNIFSQLIYSTIYFMKCSAFVR